MPATFRGFRFKRAFLLWQKDTNILGNYNCFRSKRKEYYTIGTKNFRGYINQSNFLFQISRRSWEYNFWKFCLPSLAFMSTSCSRCALMFLCCSMFTLYPYFIDTAKNNTGLHTKFWLFLSIKFLPRFYFILILISVLIPTLNLI